MVRQCVFPLCPNKMTSSSKFSFHRLPLDYPGLLKVWLVALKMDPNTEIEDLKLASHRVCSAHFAPEDFIRTKPKKKGQEPQRQNLKRTAVSPSAFFFHGAPRPCTQAQTGKDNRQTRSRSLTLRHQINILPCCSAVPLCRAAMTSSKVCLPG